MTVMQLFFIHLLLLLSSCQGDNASSYDQSNSKISNQNTALSFDNVEDPKISQLKSRIEHSLMETDQQDLIIGIDSLLDILTSTPYLFQKGIIAQYLVDMISGEAAFEGKVNDYSSYSARMITALSSQKNLCRRLSQIIKMTNGQLLRTVGSETATIAMLTHCRCLYLGEVMMRKNVTFTFEECRNMPDNGNLISFFSKHCPE